MTSAPGAAPSRAPISPGLLGVLGYLSMAGSLSTDLYLPAFPDMASDLGVGASAVQLTLTSLLIGAALGQLTVGSISDALGRRRTLIAGLTLFVLCCFLAATSPSLTFLIAIRAVQGFAGASGVVLSRAIIADLSDREGAVRAFSALFAMIALGPALANPLGAWLTEVGGWRSALLGLGVLSAGMLAAAIFFIPETLPREHRHEFRASVLAGNVGRLFLNRTYLLYAIAFGAGYASLLTYLSSSSFIVQNVLGLSPVGYSLTFSLSALAIMTGSFGSGRVARRLGPHQTFRLAQLVAMGAAATGLTVSALGLLTLARYLVIVCVFAVAAGAIMAMGSALAVGQSGRTAGAGSALLGCLQYLFGAVASPMGGILGPQTAVPAMTAMLGFAAIAFVSTTSAGRLSSRPAAPR